jgi:hypothetical protein
MTKTIYDDAVEILGSDPNEKQLRVKGADSQDESLQTWENSTGETLAQVTGQGQLRVGNMSVGGTENALVEANNDITPSSLTLQGIQSRGLVGGAVDGSKDLDWVVNELEFDGTQVAGTHSALRAKVINNAHGDNTGDAILRAGHFEARNKQGSSQYPTGKLTGVQSAVTNEDNAYLDEAVGVEVTLTNGQGGDIQTAHGLKIGDVDQGSQNNYAIYTDQGLVRLGDKVGIGVDSPNTMLDVAGAVSIRELSSDPGDPDEGSATLWMSDGTGAGYDGDLLAKVHAGDITQTSKLYDHALGRAVATETMEVKNLSEGLVTAGDLGYIDSLGDFKTTGIANVNALWAVVVDGGADASQITVQRRGRAIVKLNANCTAGQYLYTSTTPGQAAPSSILRPEVIGVALTANPNGAGGTCEALLLPNRVHQPIWSRYYIYTCQNASRSVWQGEISSIPDSDQITYNTTSGDESVLKTWSLGEGVQGKLRLYKNNDANSSALIQNVDTGTNIITLTGDVPAGWGQGTNITVESQYNKDTIGMSKFFDIYLGSFTSKPELAVAGRFQVSVGDTGGYVQMWAHPYIDEYVQAALQEANVQISSGRNTSSWWVPILDNHFQLIWNATGSNTLSFLIRVEGWVVAAP